MRALPPSRPAQKSSGAPSSTSRTGIVGDAVLDVPFRAVLVLLCRGGRPCPPCMTAAPCRAGPVCPAVGYAFFGGTHGSRPTGAYPPQKKTTRRPGWGAAGIAPYEMARGMCIRAGRVVRPYFLSFHASPRREASALGVQTGVGIRIPARRRRADGTSRTPSPTGRDRTCRRAGCSRPAAPLGRTESSAPSQRKKRRLPPSLFIQLYCRTTAVTLPSRVA